MADQKISQLTDGTSFQSGDEAVVNRGGVNYKIDPTQFGSSIDVAGTVTADGLTVDGGSKFSGSADESSSGGLSLKAGLIDASISNSTDAFIGIHNTGGIGTLAGDLLLVPRSSTGVANSIQLFSGQTTPKLRQKIADNGDISFYEDTGTTPKFFWDASAEALGIGTTSPSGALDIGGQHVLYDNYDMVGASFTRYGTYGSVLSLGRKGVSSGVTLDYPADNTFALSTNSSEAMRIDSSGNLLVGTTTYNSANQGILLGSTGVIYSTGTSGISASFGRNTTDGSIVNFRKDNTTVGSIGSSAGTHLSIGNGDTGLAFLASVDAISPYTMTGVDGRDAAIDLGTSTRRFKDLYLSGGVYLGGTTAANLLDDYEEGTWTPSALFSSSNGDLAQPTQVGRYTKIGNMVHIQGFLQFTESTASGDFSISGLPFAASNISGNYSASSIYGHNLSSISGNLQVIMGGDVPANTMIVFYLGTGTRTRLTESNTGTNTSFAFDICYQI